VSLIFIAASSSRANVIFGFKYFSASGNDFVYVVNIDSGAPKHFQKLLPTNCDFNYAWAGRLPSIPEFVEALTSGGIPPFTPIP
jgi:hypothetical protein